MCGLGMGELLIILLIVALLFGASKLPQLGRALGETIRNFKQSSGPDAGDSAKKLEPIDVQEVGRLAERKPPDEAKTDEQEGDKQEGDKPRGS